MNARKSLASLFGSVIATFVLVSVAVSESGDSPATSSRAKTESRAAGTRVRFVQAFVVDDRLSALRREANIGSEVIERLRLGHRVFIIEPKRRGQDQREFCRIAVTRRRRGWIHQAALAVPGVAGDDGRMMKLIDASTEGVDRITLCRLLTENFGRSPLVPRALLIIGDEAERAAESLSPRARKRLGELEATNLKASLRDYYLSDAWLDRYSKLGVGFDFNESTAEYVYNGQAYRNIIKRFPDSSQATAARARLELMQQKLARR